LPNKFLQFLVILKYLRKDYSELLFTFILVKKVIENNQAYVHSIVPVCQPFFSLALSDNWFKRQLAQNQCLLSLDRRNMHP